MILALLYLIGALVVTGVYSVLLIAVTAPRAHRNGWRDGFTEGRIHELTRVMVREGTDRYTAQERAASQVTAR